MTQNINKRLLHIVIVGVGLFFSGLANAGKSLTLEEQYQTAKSKIEWHCATCMGSSKEELLVGIHLLEKVMKQGFDSAEARVALANGYNQMWVVFSDNKGDKEAWKRKMKVLLTESIQAYPNDDKLLAEFADEVGSDSEKIRLLEKALAINPKNTDAGYHLGTILLRAGKHKKAFDVFKQALLKSTQGETYTYGREMSQRFFMQGMEKEAKEIDTLVDEIFKERNRKGVQ